MIGFGILLGFAAYGIGSYGFVLIKGYDITPRQWFSPFHPFVWPAPGTTIPTVPKGHLMPTGTAGNSTSGGGPQGGPVPGPTVI